MARNWWRFAAIMLLLALFAALPLGRFGAAAAQEAPAAAGNQAQTPGGSAKGSFGTQLAAGELTRIDQQIEAQSQALDQLTRKVNAGPELEPLRQQLATLKVQAESICAAEEPQKRKFVADLESVMARFQATSVGDFVTGWAAPTFTELCTTTQPDALLRDFEVATNFSDAPTQRAEAEKMLADLAERREQVLRQMTEDLAGTSVADNIPWLMLIIFGVGAATLGGVKIFSDEIQRELVASGQIVQFVTILILLGVILALGLAQRLQAETLGTLLGGLAGYVLSQGVGRQAQQQVLNEIKSAAAVASPPPPPPPVEPVLPPELVPGPDAAETRPA